ncbi:ATP-dependent helicase [Chryseobacterium gallinarum]|uniref:UvrD-helicase domain-containing protein n=1 Tax=Chryseobacterium gallinarum TaxID=1324352 RepID=UPI00202481A2|nr:ATP-dependent helicase [Chryseobacterium gallinarum]MCL8537676.1 ATP-dependent helicase [Chryseobacterium gallinarum]
MKRINPGLWIPADNMQLEESALGIAKNSENHLVVAGPGAGKTELLAQKACYLLQTNVCSFPHKILAISFKRDAAFNLKERVRKRCGDELSKRFDSLTFDSFAKQILDRFKQALPNEYKIGSEYEVILNDQFIFDQYRKEDIQYFSTTTKDEIISFHSGKLPHDSSIAYGTIRRNIWEVMLKSTPSKLSFKMIMRLAELIINANPKIKQYLQQTYKYVFLDEFQDTTHIQYDLFKSCFLDSKSFFTAVGDDKQRIMLWAGAKETVFDDFIADTEASRVPLAMNFRSAPRLVKLLNHLTEHLLNKKDFATPSPKWLAEQGECSVWMFENPDDEMKILFQEVSDWINHKSIDPRNICILVKQQLATYAGKLIEYFNQNGIKSRDENKFEDILTQEICLYIINVLYRIFDRKNIEAKKGILDFLINIHTELVDDQLLRLEGALEKFIKDIRKEHPTSILKAETIRAIIAKAVEFADKDRILTSSQNINSMEEMDKYIEKVQVELLQNFSITKNVISALNMLVGKDTIPVMTIHKSKGLEYHTVIFIGLEDGAFWSFQKQPDEDKCAFFVALSRAKERVVFTFSEERDGRFGIQPQTIDKIGVLFDELQKSGVVNILERKV